MIHFNSKHKISRINPATTSSIMVYDSNGLYQTFVLIEDKPSDKILIRNKIYDLKKEKSKNTFKAEYKEKVLPQIIEINNTIIKKIKDVRNKRNIKR